MKDKLARFLKTGKGWSRLPTSVPGVFIQKMPEWKGREAVLAVELNPVDAAGQPTKKNGLRLKSTEEFQAFLALINHESLPKVLAVMDGVNPAYTPPVSEAAIQI